MGNLPWKGACAMDITPLTVTPAEGAKYLGIGTTKMWKLLRSGRIKAKVLDGRYRITIAELNAFHDALPDAPVRVRWRA